MTHAREDDQTAGNDVAASREWLRPAVQRFDAGSAEDDSGPSSDGILNPS